jgi:hypothetical protein
MKNLLICLTVLAFMAGPELSLMAQPQYYNYNTSGSGSNSFPFNISGGKDVQLLYLPGDFNQPAAAPAGNITSISFLISNSYPLGPWTYTDLTIKMGQSTLNTFATGTFYTGALTTVYYRASIQLQAAGGTWMTFVLDTPFPYNPAQSLIVDVGQCGVPGASGFSMVFTTLSGARRNYSVGGCPFAYGGQNAAIYHTGINVQTSGPPVVTTTAATGVTTSAATLNGTVNANGATTTVTFEYGLTTAYGSTIAGVPGTVSGSSVTPVTANLTGLLPGNTYHYRTVGTNANGTSNGNDMSFTTTAIAPTVVTTAASNVGSTTASVNGTIDAGGASTAVTFEYGLTAAYGSTVPGIPATVTGNAVTPVTANLTGLTMVTTYHYRAVGVNSIGTTYGSDMTFTTTSCPMPGVPGPISGPANPCGNSLGNVYSVAPIPFAQSYAWSVPPGAVITSGNSTNSITVTMGNTSGNVSVYGIDTCGNGPVGTLPVTVLTAPVPTVTGPASMCVNSGYFNYVTEPGMTGYTWAVSSGGTITWGQGTNQVQVAWPGSGAQWVSVNYVGPTGCMAGTPTVYAVAVEPVPAAAGTITGTAAVCGGATGISYSVAPIAGATAYVWDLPDGAVITNGEWTNVITVDFATDASSGNITVYGNNVCGNGALSPAFAVTVTPLPDDAGIIAGPAAVCIGDAGVAYSVGVVNHATGYTWTLPAGATIATGANTNAITVDFGASAVSGDITVTGTNSCGNGGTSPAFAVAVNPVPPAPAITESGDTLTSDAPSGNQWYYEGNAIPGATGQTYVATQSGEHWSVVTLNGCSSGESNHIAVIITGTGQQAGIGVGIRPVPNDGRFTVTVAAPAAGTISVEVYNSLGIKVTETGNSEVAGRFEKTIDMRPASNGVYIVVIRNNDTRIVQRIVVTN